MRLVPATILTMILALNAAPAAAQQAAQVPEPSNLGLAILGLAGLIIGRQVAKRRGQDESSRD